MAAISARTPRPTSARRRFSTRSEPFTARCHKLRDLCMLCQQHADGRTATFVFLGDYIDRGPDSRGVIEALIELQSQRPDRIIALKGNHEAVAAEILRGETDPESWLREGGTATLRSYRIDDVRNLPPEHVA